MFKIEKVGKIDQSTSGETTQNDLSCVRSHTFNNGYLHTGSLTNSTGIYKGYFFNGIPNGAIKRYTVDGKFIDEVEYSYGKVLYG